MRLPAGRSFRLFGSLLLAIAGAAGCVYGWGEHHLREANRALLRMDWDDAQRHLDSCLKIRPNDPDLQLLAARTARRRGLQKEAQEHLAAVIRLAGATPESALEADMQRAQQGDMASVEPSLRALVAADDPRSDLILEALARGYFSTLRLPDALKAIQMLLDRRPDHFHALLWRGQEWEDRNQPEKALEDYERALDMHPSSLEARIRLARMLYRVGRVREATGQYEYLSFVQPEDDELSVLRARCWFDLHEIDRARAILDHVLDRQPDLVPALLERGRLAIRIDESAQADGWLQKAARLAPDNQEVQFTMALCLEMQGKAAEGHVYRARGQQIETAVARKEHLMSKISDIPQDPELRYQLGKMFLAEGHEQEASNWFQSALSVESGHRPSRAALDRLQNQLRDH